MNIEQLNNLTIASEELLAEIEQLTLKDLIIISKEADSPRNDTEALYGTLKRFVAILNKLDLNRT